MAELSFESVDAAIKKADLRVLKTAARLPIKGIAAMDVRDLAAQICAIWKVVRPIIMLVMKLPLIPKKWKDLLQTFIDLLDSICGK